MIFIFQEENNELALNMSFLSTAYFLLDKLVTVTLEKLLLLWFSKCAMKNLECFENWQGLTS